ncbi:MAG: hypothetical protein V2A65_04470 [Candidatus Omnitrophota bacterium]
MKRDKPRVGFLLLTGEWFKQIGAHKGLYQDLPHRLIEDSHYIVQALGKELEVINPGIVNSAERIGEATKTFQQAQIDLILVCYLMWGEDYLFLDFLKKFPHTPILLWCYTPSARIPKNLNMAELFRRSGPVATVQASGPLRRLGRKFGFAFGSPENRETIKTIINYSYTAKLASDLKKVRIGLLPGPCRAMSGTFVDEPRLKKEIGPQVEHISVRQYAKIVETIPEKKTEEYIKKLKDNYRVCGVSDAALFKAAKASLGLAEVINEFRLDCLALQDLDEELHQVIGLRPCLSVPSIFEKAVVSMEGDVGAAVALLILKRLTGKPTMYAEIFTFDEKENAILAGHAGMMDIRLAERERKEELRLPCNDIMVRIVPDYEYCEVEPETASMLFRAKGGKVTLLSIFCDTEKFKFVITSGEAVAGKIFLEGSPHILVKLKVPLKEFFTQIVMTGITQHWAIVHDEVTEELIDLAEILNVDCLVVK